MKTTKRSLLTTAICLLLTAVMLLGSTFAWFTDSVTNTGNKIEAGTLDVQLLQDGKDISANEAPVFNYNLWEPGYSTGANLAVKNNGTLAIAYELELQKVVATQGIEHVIDVYVNEVKLGTLADFMNGENLAEGKLLTVGATSETYSVKLAMQTSADNQYQGATATFDILLKATQTPYEHDGFDNPNYDANITYIPDEVIDGAEGLDTVVSGGTGLVGEANTNVDASPNNAWFAAYADKAAIDYVTGFDNGEFVIRVRPQKIDGTTLGYIIANVRGENTADIKAKIEFNKVNSGHPEITNLFEDLGNGWYEFRTATTSLGDELGYIICVGYTAPESNGKKGEAYIRTASGWDWDSYKQVENLENDTVVIANSDDLVNAIKNQADGQTWLFTQAGTFDAATPAEDGNNGGYDLPAGVDMPYPAGQMAKHPGPYPFPIYAENLTIKKAENVTGEVVLTSSAVATLNNDEVVGVNGGGNWNWQSFMIISGSGVTIEGVTLKGNQNNYNVNGNAGGLVGKQCDKIIETVDGAGDLTLRNVVIAPLTVDGETGNYEKYNGTRRSGSIYFSHAYSADKTVTLDNVYTYGGIKSVNNVNIALNGVTVDATNNTYSEYNATTASYAWNPGIRGNGTAASLSNVTNNGFTIIMDNGVDMRQIFNDSLLSSTTVVMTEGEYDITTNASTNTQHTGGIVVTTPNITIKGEGEAVVKAKTTGGNGGIWEGINQQNTLTVAADNVTIDGLTFLPIEMTNNGNSIAPKALEVTNAATNFTLKNCTFEAMGMSNTLTVNTGKTQAEAFGTYYGGQISINTSKDSNKDTIQILNNTFNYAVLDLRTAATITGNTFNSNSQVYHKTALRFRYQHDGSGNNGVYSDIVLSDNVFTDITPYVAYAQEGLNLGLENIFHLATTANGYNFYTLQ